MRGRRECRVHAAPAVSCAMESVARTSIQAQRRHPASPARVGQLDVRLSDLEARFACRACGKRGADVRPNFNWNARGSVGGMGYRAVSSA